MIETLAKTAMLGLFAAAAPLDTAEPALWANWGLAGVVVMYVLWRDWQRERRLSAAIDSQQRWVRDTLVATLERNAAAMERLTACDLRPAAGGNSSDARPAIAADSTSRRSPAVSRERSDHAHHG